MIRNWKYILPLTLLLGGCEKENSSTTALPVPADGELCIAGYAASSESPHPLRAGYDVFFWGDEVAPGGRAVPFFNAWKQTSDGKGGFTEPSGKQSFPSGDSTLDLYAIHTASGDFVAGETPFPADGIAVEVPADQTSEASLRDADLLYAACRGAAKDDGLVRMTFYHLLSKVEVCLMPGEGVSAEELRKAEVRIEGTRRQGLFKPEKLTAGELSEAEKRAAMITVNETDASPIRIAAVVNTDASSAGKYASAVVVPQKVGGHLISVTLPDAEPLYYDAESQQLESGKTYTYRVSVSDRGLDVTVQVSDWQQGGDTAVVPDYDDKITVDTAETPLPEGAQLSGTKDHITLRYDAAEFILTASCRSDLELQPVTSDVLTVTAREGEPNSYTVHKRLLPPGYAAQEVRVMFRRKGLTEVYDEDCITLLCEAHPVKLEGLLAFDPATRTCDFGDYIDGELGVLTLPEGKKAEVRTEGKAWAKLSPSEDKAANRQRLLGGWKPNDPEGDGREQTAQLVICDADGGNEETYTFKRRNWSLPVVNIDGTWWCKYNLRGNSKSFGDQILAKDDPAMKEHSGDVAKYLETLSGDGYLTVLGGSYLGGRTQSLTLAQDGHNFYYSDYTTEGVKDIGTLPATEMTPAGYRLPSKEDWQFFVPNENCNLGYGSNKSIKNKNNKTISYTVIEKENVTLKGLNYGQINFIHFWYNGAHVVFCGLGQQWASYTPDTSKATSGKMSKMHPLLGTVNGNEGTWLIESYEKTGKRQNWFKYAWHAAEHTRTLRCIKSPVEYQYE